MVMDELRIDITANDKFSSTFDKANGKLQFLNALSQDTGMSMKHMSDKMGQLHWELERTGSTGMRFRNVMTGAFQAPMQSVKELSKEMRSFDMRLLSVMFFGMQMQKTFGGALKSLHDTFTKVNDDSGMLNNTTMKVTAAFEFLKFSIWNSLEQSGVYQSVVEFLVKAINWVSNLVTKFPALGIGIVAAFGALAAGGAVLFTIGQFGLFWGSVFGEAGLLVTTAAGGAGSVTTAFSAAFSGINILIGGVVVALAALAAVIEDKLNKKLDELQKRLPSNPSSEIGKKIEEMVKNSIFSPLLPLVKVFTAVGTSDYALGPLNDGLNATDKNMSLVTDSTSKMSTQIVDATDSTKKFNAEMAKIDNIKNAVYNYEEMRKKLKDVEDQAYRTASAAASIGGSGGRKGSYTKEELQLMLLHGMDITGLTASN